MQNTFSQSGNDSKWFLKKSFFRIGMWNSRPLPPPFTEKNILNFHFDYLNTSLTYIITIDTNNHHYHQYNQPSLSSIQINLMVMGSLDAMESGSGGVASVLPAPTLPSSLREKGGKV